MVSNPVVYKGYFTLGNDGSFTFTPATSPPPAVPPAPLLLIQRSGNSSTISFGTTNWRGLLALLHQCGRFDQSGCGLGAVGQHSDWQWPTNSFSDTTTDASRVYRVMAH